MGVSMYREKRCGVVLDERAWRVENVGCLGAMVSLGTNHYDQQRAWNRAEWAMANRQGALLLAMSALQSL